MSALYELIIPLLNGSVAGGLHPDQAPENPTVPYAVYAEIASPPINSLGGQANLRNTRLQITVWAETKVESVSVAATLYALMKAQSIYGSPAAFQVTPLNEGTSLVDPDTRLRGTILEFSCWRY